MFYDVKFGRKKAPEEKEDVANGQAAVNSSSVTASGNGHVKKTPELAIYEQYRNQVVCTKLVEWCW